MATAADAISARADNGEQIDALFAVILANIGRRRHVFFVFFKYMYVSLVYRSIDHLIG